MKTLLLACLLAFAFCEEYYTYHFKGGDMIVNQEKPVKVSGPIYIEFLKTMNLTIISGMHEKGAQRTPFGFVNLITSIVMKDGQVEMIGKCKEGGWGTNMMGNLEGVMRITGTKDKIHYVGNCSHKESKMNFTIIADAVASKCPFYLPPEGAARAHTLVGESSEKYQPNHVLNFALFGYPYINTLANCSVYLNMFPDVSDVKPGFLVVGKDGKHCGLFDKEGDKFIHSNPAAKKVTLTSNVQLKNFFPAGYVIKEYKCQLSYPLFKKLFRS
eukprot:TRINITY_DN623_c0_g1_i1.p1 TRINITY_DN623_c0_g1~~TRINITY_DN623_c0_g1_i1.p1  ORF type:complete len:271 (-),score=38.33 TRINITY_DN623_c0_g1_i1:11-823(-)